MIVARSHSNTLTSCSPKERLCLHLPGRPHTYGLDRLTRRQLPGHDLRLDLIGQRARTLTPNLLLDALDHDDLGVVGLELLDQAFLRLADDQVVAHLGEIAGERRAHLQQCVVDDRNAPARVRVGSEFIGIRNHRRSRNRRGGLRPPRCVRHTCLPGIRQANYHQQFPHYHLVNLMSSIREL